MHKKLPLFLIRIMMFHDAVSFAGCARPCCPLREFTDEDDMLHSDHKRRIHRISQSLVIVLVLIKVIVILYVIVLSYELY